MADLYLALIHYPVVNKRGETVGSAVTNLDIHDIARASATFGVHRYYVVTPYEDQVALTRAIMSHWTEGAGGQVNPARKQALERVIVKTSLEEAVQDIQAHSGRSVIRVATSARSTENTVSCGTLKRSLEGNAAHVLIFGTAWGLTQELIAGCEMILEPILGSGEYNHLSVRSAASIYLDRLTNGDCATKGRNVT